MNKVRLDKFLADQKIGTRSEVKKLIRDKKVLVNQQLCTVPETKVDPDIDQVTIGNQSVKPSGLQYFLFSKPAGCVTATKDNFHKTVLDYFPKELSHLIPVGRLDKDTEGLLLMTDDGMLVHELLSPRKHVKKQYFLRAAGQIDPEKQRQFETGLDIGDKKKTMPAKMVICSEKEESYEALVTIQEGRFHQVKRMIQKIGGEVQYLKRVSMGPITLEDKLKPGMFRPLTNEEIKRLKQDKE